MQVISTYIWSPDRYSYDNIKTQSHIESVNDLVEYEKASREHWTKTAKVSGYSYFGLTLFYPELELTKVIVNTKLPIKQRIELNPKAAELRQKKSVYKKATFQEYLTEHGMQGAPGSISAWASQFNNNQA